ncbi:hypothetical protein AVEN_77568-1 [Araneus ventricosus]|uniref:Uncharacterized protein n=1 Tax=Araneus ventricosus TaxID=182803 RepID=A0A4Y2S862_ARAVE|nr:hypothetical protein AVEN_77568-1 [Araneus ventricosus]
MVAFIKKAHHNSSNVRNAVLFHHRPLPDPYRMGYVLEVTGLNYYTHQGSEIPLIYQATPQLHFRGASDGNYSLIRNESIEFSLVINEFP